MSTSVESLVHVVIVEDNVDANNLMRDWLKSKFNVTSFLDAESTLRILPPSPEPLVFLIDYNMPGDSGMVLKSKLMPRFPKARYILISGLFDERLTREARNAGFEGLLSKPFGMAALTQKIDDVLEAAPRGGLVDFVKRQSGKLAFLT
jgi:DNA-binding NtrC family response regulator